jgi:aspartyl-tRNA(Asn)/glutamyl-tRNA(Gln) amidotransferase subunit A
VLVTPTAITGSPTYDFLDAEDIMALMGKIHTSYWDAMGNPAMVVPMGFTEGGLPLSLQLAGRPFDEATLVKVGDAFQGVTDWHRSVPAYASDPVAA